jgi:hypothetical protein
MGRVVYNQYRHINGEPSKNLIERHEIRVLNQSGHVRAVKHPKFGVNKLIFHLNHRLLGHAVRFGTSAP